MTWYRSYFHPCVIRLAHADSPELASILDPRALDVLDVAPDEPMHSARPRSYYSPVNDAVFFNPRSWDTYLHHAFPRDPFLHGGKERAHMVPSKNYPSIRQHIEQALSGNDMQKTDRHGLESAYEHIQEGMENPWGYVALGYPTQRERYAPMSREDAEQAMPRYYEHEGIHRTQSKYGHGDTEGHLPQGDYEQMRSDNPYWRELFRGLRHKGYNYHPSTIATEGAAHIGSGDGPRLFRGEGAPNQEEAQRRSYLWLHNYINFLLEKHGPVAAREMFIGAHPEVEKALEDAIRYYERHNRVNWLSPQHEPKW